jgi:hypothetical protein
MNIKLRTALIAVTLTALPALASASPESRSLKACTAAFVSTIAEGAGTAPNYRVDYAADPSVGPLAAYYTAAYTFDLQAQKPGTSEVMARASCTASKTGTVVSITTLPLDLVATLPAARL